MEATPQDAQRLNINFTANNLFRVIHDESINTTLYDLTALQQEEDEDDYIVKPTEFSLRTALRAILGAYTVLWGQFPRPAIAPTGDGGLRFEWRLNNRFLAMVCPARSDQESYLYHEDENEYASVNDVSAECLIRWLRWLLENGRNHE